MERGLSVVGLRKSYGERHAVDTVDRRPVHAVEKLARVGAEGLDVAALPFGIQRVKHQARLARAARPRHDRHFAGADVEVEVLQVVLAGTADSDEPGRRAAPRPGVGPRGGTRAEGERGLT